MHKQNKSLSKGLAVLRLIASSQKPLNASYMCRVLDIDKSTMSRLIATLMQEHFITYTQNSKEIILSDFTKNFTVKETREKIIEQTQNLLDEIYYLTNEAAYIGVLDNDALLILNQIDKSNRVLKTRNSIGLHLPLHTNAFGKIILSFANIDLKTLELKKYTNRTFTSVNKLQKELDLIAERGYATGNEEHEYGLKSLAVPYFGTNNQFLGALGISGLAIRLDEETLHNFGQKIYQTINI
ncbi:MAG: IclR family transcriptional regulator [Sulfurospirillum sp.]|nr:IclR family transcriptional regulator [Sulfurospirillum sp.]